MKKVNVETVLIDSVVVLVPKENTKNTYKKKHIQKKHIQKKTHTKITYNHARHEIPRLSDNENNESTSRATSLGWRIRNEAFRIRENVEKGPQILKQRKRYRLTFQLAVSHNAALRKLTTASKI